ncbi:uncharacterized protein LOC118470641 [Amphiprion ocellaris]|uniref:uncharacterized protein LOC118470652 n=1 Tax=Amphiprion ocellaris TaxID=80972 RepID=UPI001649A94A|nr:uncharacterized protein LOC118470652 [Amphiprion ocellaris]XP_054862090.1 uncharacterized protein LOC118470641 [Amphiprion ocellaris]XP_054862091.1 uncharacterized protein LOC118470641 [Amphiprion ocellaris]XP_054862092.1 uncharacterized protein LOC118470641 [Amphiprion ocellaris]
METRRCFQKAPISEGTVRPNCSATDPQDVMNVQTQTSSLKDTLRISLSVELKAEEKSKFSVDLQEVESFHNEGDIELLDVESVHSDEDMDPQEVKSVHTLKDEKEEEDGDLQEVERIYTPIYIMSETLDSVQKDEKTPKSQKSREKFKLRVDVVVDSLLLYIFKEARYGRESEHFDTVSERLFKRVWAEVQDEDYDLSKRNFKKLNKGIYKKICKRLQTKDPKLLVNLLLWDCADDTVDSIIKEALMNPPKKSSIRSRMTGIFKRFSGTS